ncbi:MAG: penicillin-binding protein 2 [Candidatus Omnitrophota bacterium]
MKSEKYPQTPKSDGLDQRLHLLLSVVAAAFVMLVFRLWTLQVYQKEKFEDLAKVNYVREVVVPSERGKILDRHGRPMAEDVSFWDVWISIATDRREKRIVTPAVSRSLQILSEILEKPYAALENTYKTKKRDSNYKHKRVLIESRAPFDKYVAIEERRIEFPMEAMVFTVETPNRRYRYGDLAGHVLGYTGNINSTQLQEERYTGYSPRDRVGISGVEYQYEEYLRGQDGTNQIFVDKLEIQHGSAIEIKPAISGNDVQLSLDYKLQLAAETILGASRGVIVVTNVKDNSLLALASSPRYDPNDIITHYGKYLLDPSHPLVHRAISARYEPGSVFKVFEMFGLLEDLKVDPSERVYCPGSFSLPGRAKPWRCHKREGHGSVDMIQALSKSCDVYFYEMAGRRLGIDRMAACAIDFGLGDKTNIDLPNEQWGPFPSRATKREWVPGFTINQAIGQGDILLTPIQISTAICAVANRGTLNQPHVAQKIHFSDGKTPDLEIQSTPSGTIEASSRTFSIVQKAMWEVCNDVIGGTGRRVYDQDPNNPWRYVIDQKFTVAGKTGTAQHGGELDHAWFVCFGPFENPEIVITVLLEDAGHGGEVAAPLAKKLIEVYRGRVELQDLV